MVRRRPERKSPSVRCLSPFRCKKWDVPIEKIYSKTQREKFRWAIDMATAEYHFYNYEGEIVLRNVDETNNGDDDDDDEQQQNSDDE